MRMRGDFWPHREGNGLPPATKGRHAPPMGYGRPFSSTRDRLSGESRSAQHPVLQCAPKAPIILPTVLYSASNVPATPDGTTLARLSEARLE